ncbi:helix-turn-helix domain-containing protein [Rubrivivax rivuli]|uniref:XRE family transcriptional regulator n=1 Tax=Rubrivivax rivuli TaxID=1862385 RepID=A0A437RH85_9BURK|nr:helix-turn-helix transcriptional regulator [Rubrivivax rivuli]RVU46098.1 XRE family transcriptional regulator [Rubrivivax rivuli]
MKTVQIIDLVCMVHAWSDYRLAKELHVSPSAVSNWRAGRSFPEPVLCVKLAALAGVEPGQVIAQVEAERAERAGKMDQVKTWNTWLGKMTGTAAAVIMSASMSGVSTDAGAMPVDTQTGNLLKPIVCILC